MIIAIAYNFAPNRIFCARCCFVARHTMDAVRLTLFDPSAEQTFQVDLQFEGPDGTRAEQNARRDYVYRENVCPGDQLDIREMMRSLKRPTMRIALLRISHSGVDSGWLPEKLADVLYRDGRRARSSAPIVGMYAFDVEQPCVLEYICLQRRVQGFRFGKFLYQHFENYIRAMYSTQCRNLYLAATNFDAVLAFYGGLGYELLATPPEENIAMTPEPGVEIFVRLDTALMRKRLTATPAEPDVAKPQPPLPPITMIDDPTDTVVMEVSKKATSVA